MKTFGRAGLFVILNLHGVAQAQSTELLPDADAGKRRAAVCFACHNANGVAGIPGVPNLAGQHSEYLEIALRAYRDGQGRHKVIMNAMAKPLSDGDIANIAAYFSVQQR
ncbi:cytochrome c [Paraburkholderia sp. BR10937]|uniref:cytochrome c n=1 Tax=Paraburkholderia sp. BR10937 TaxID=3236994 RepID=UPI0034D1C9B2